MPILVKDILLGAHVETDIGEGFLVGRSAKDDPHYDVRLFDGRICSSYGTGPHFSKITLINNYPVDHPKLPAGLRDYIRRTMPL